MKLFNINKRENFDYFLRGFCYSRDSENNEWDIVQKFIIQGITDYTNTNEKSCTYLAPFADGLIAEKIWYKNHKYLLKGKHDITLVDKIDKNAYRQSIEFKNLYNDYLDHYNYERDMTIMEKEVSFVHMNTDELRDILSGVYKVDKLDEDIKYKSWYNKLEETINKYSNRCFVRSERVSAKNDGGKKIISNADECLLYLGKSQDILKSLCELRTNNTYIVVMPWNDKIKLSNEFRVFILNGKIKAISQQKWYIYAGLTRQYIHNIINDLYHGCIEICKKLPYIDASLDVWIDEDNKVHLIEANPGGRWCCSASMLFNWTEDSLWEEDGPIHIRYVEQNVIEYSEID